MRPIGELTPDLGSRANSLWLAAKCVGTAAMLVATSLYATGCSAPERPTQRVDLSTDDLRFPGGIPSDVEATLGSVVLVYNGDNGALTGFKVGPNGVLTAGHGFPDRTCTNADIKFGDPGDAHAIKAQKLVDGYRTHKGTPTGPSDLALVMLPTVSNFQSLPSIVPAKDHTLAVGDQLYLASDQDSASVGHIVDTTNIVEAVYIGVDTRTGLDVAITVASQNTEAPFFGASGGPVELADGEAVGVMTGGFFSPDGEELEFDTESAGQATGLSLYVDGKPLDSIIPFEFTPLDGRNADQRWPRVPAVRC